MSWGIVASAVAFWLNILIKGVFPEKLNDLLIAPMIEEIAKYLGIRQTRSVVVPIVFLVCESVIQLSTTLFLVKEPLAVLLFTVMISLISLKHILFYCINKLTNYRVYGMILAIGAHSLWNWYVISQEDKLQLAVISLLVIILPTLTLWKKN